MHLLQTTHLYARLPKVDTESVRVPAIMLDQLLQCSESCSPCNEESSIIKLPVRSQNITGVVQWISMYLIL